MKSRAAIDFGVSHEWRKAHDPASLGETEAHSPFCPTPRSKIQTRENHARKRPTSPFRVKKREKKIDSKFYMRIQAEAPATYYTTGLISEKQQGQCLALFKTRPKIFLAVNRIWPFSTPTEICTYLLGKNEDFLYFF